MFGRGKKKLKKDKATRELQASGVYTLGHAPHPYVVDQETTKAVKEKKVYSFWGGVWYVTILSILLFWIPPFGQMIAGYVGGRKAGTPKKGLVAALVPMCIIFLLFALYKLEIMVDEIGWLFSLPQEGADYLATNLPVVGPLISFVTEYLRTFIETLGFGGNFIISPYVLTVIFGYVGGILSLQHQRERDAEESTSGAPVMIAAPQQQPVIQPQQEETTVVMGKKPDGWDMKKKKN